MGSGSHRPEETVRGLTLDGERALYNLRDSTVEGCLFSGPADGESALKECRDVTVRGCRFDLRYPMWHARGLSIEDSVMTETCRAPLWYCSGVRITGLEAIGVKCLRECEDVSVEGSRLSTPEFGWKCRGVAMRDSDLESEYMFLDSSDITLERCRVSGKYSFQYTSGVTVRNCVISTKDAFWHSRDVTVEDSEVSGEYLGWYSENLTLVRCRISGTQPLCYCRNLRLVDCSMEGCDLSFEYSDVDATVTGHIDSVKNPRSGRIRAGSIGEVVLGDQVMDCSCTVETDNGCFDMTGKE